MGSLVLGVCLALAASPDTSSRFIETDRFTLAWTHSIEKTRWEEDYQILMPSTTSQAPQLIATRARIQGSAAGMEPPPEATLVDGWFQYRPQQPPTNQIPLMRSGYTDDYDWCMNRHCVPLQQIFPSDGDITILSACVEP